MRRGVNKTPLALSFFLFLFHASSLQSMEEMAVMMGAQQGASIADEAISTMYSDMGASLQMDESTVQNSLTQFSAQAVQAETAQAKTLGKIFTGAINHVAKKEGDQSQYAQQMDDYLNKFISIHKMPTYYLLNSQATFDQAFEHGTMYTPQGQIWKNVFQFGDWEYDYATDSFYQFKNAPIFSTQTDPDTQKSTQTSTPALYNSIFTEYLTNSASYEIQCEITLYQIKYPFFAGIQFNRTRWISGNADSLSCSRLLGIYGTSENNVATFYTEQATVPLYKKQKTTTQPQLLSPLDQIVQKKATKQEALPSKLFTNISTQPTTFVVRIITSATTVQFKIWPKSKTEPKEFTTIKNIQKNLYLYHGIGFVCPGAIAQFKLIKPQDLLFSTTAKKDFAQEITTLLASPQ